jgi:hypothetical protein
VKTRRAVAIVLFAGLVIPIGEGRASGAGDQSTLAGAAEAARTARPADDEPASRSFSNDDLVTDTTSGEADFDVVTAGPVGPAGALGGRRYEVPYQAFGGTARRVIVNVRFNGSVTAPVALDTGAPGTIIEAGLASRLGLLDGGRGGVMTVAGGIGGTVPAVRTIIDTIEVGEARQEFALVTVVESLSPQFEGLLGLDFLSGYSVGIDPQAQMLVMEEVPAGQPTYGGRDERWWRSSFAELSTMRRQWADYRDEVAAQNSASAITREQLAFAETQFGEADALFRRLTRRAQQFAVPTYWRESGAR